MTKNRVLVFGGSGLIGAPACNLLVARGCEVASFSRGIGPPGVGIEAIMGDITVPADVEAAFTTWHPNLVLQLAACLQMDCENDPARGVDVNVTGATNVLSACATHGVRRIVYGSSIAAYGERTDLMQEDDPPSNSISLYGMQKRLVEVLGHRFASLYGNEFVALRYSGVFGLGGSAGAGMSLARSLLIKSANGEDVLVDFANGDETAHLTYVLDAAEATVCAMLNVKLSYGVYNIGGPAENFLSLKQMHKQVRSVAPATGQAAFTGKARSAGPIDTGRMERDLGYTPRYSVAEALREILLVH